MIYSPLLYTIVIYILLSTEFLLCSVPYDNSNSHLNSAESSYKHLSKEAEKDHACLKKALDNLSNACSKLDEHELHYLALQFTMCHFTHNQRDILYPDCKFIDSTLVSKCTSKLSGDEFSVFTQFYTHTRASCYFIQNQIWQEQTSSTIDSLASVSSETVNKLQKSLEQNEELLDGQNSIKETSTQILSDQDILHRKIEESKETMDILFEHLSNYSKLILDSISSVNTHLRILLGHSQSMGSVFYYLSILAFAYFLTNHHRTIRIRFALYAIIILYFMIERAGMLFIHYYDLISIDSAARVSYYGRFFITLLLCAIAIWFAYNYRDYREAINSLSSRIQNLEEHQSSHFSRLEEYQSSGFSRLEEFQSSQFSRFEICQSSHFSRLTDSLERVRSDVAKKTPTKDFSIIQQSAPRTGHSAHRTRTRLSFEPNLDGLSDDSSASPLRQTLMTSFTIDNSPEVTPSKAFEKVNKPGDYEINSCNEIVNSHNHTQKCYSKSESADLLSQTPLMTSIANRKSNSPATPLTVSRYNFRNRNNSINSNSKLVLDK